MGWSGGGLLAEDIWDAVRKLIPAGRAKMEAARKIMRLMQDMDCDTIIDAQQLCRDAGYDYDETKDEYVYTRLPNDPPPLAPQPCTLDEWHELVGEIINESIERYVSALRSNPQEPLFPQPAARAS